MKSFTPVTVIVCGTFQLTVSKVMEGILTNPSRISDEVTGMVTGELGAEFKTMEKESESPASEVCSMVLLFTEIPGCGMFCGELDSRLLREPERSPLHPERINIIERAINIKAFLNTISPVKM
jgi:hypothetical protein